jgi:Restriction endonuclease
MEPDHLTILSSAVQYGPYRVYVVDGPRGSGKTSLARALVSTVARIFPGRIQTVQGSNAYEFRPPDTTEPFLHVVDDAEYLTRQAVLRLFAFANASPNGRFVLLGRGLTSSLETNAAYSFGYIPLYEKFRYDDSLDASDFSWRGITDASGLPVAATDLTASPLIIDVAAINDELLRHLSDHPESIRVLTPRKFEEVVAELLQRKGYSVILTPESKDGGFDIYAARRDDLAGEFLYLVECKRYVPPHHVGIHVVRALNGVRDLHRATGAAVVTTSYFTKPAREYQAQFQHQLQLHDYATLQRWLASVLGKGI